MVLSDRELNSIFYDLFPSGSESDKKLINPASIDIRIGRTLKLETFTGWADSDLSLTSQQNAFILHPGDFVLVSTYERLRVPNGYAIELKLKSSRAREGYNHSLAFWFDPGWDGVGTMEIKNNLKHHMLPLWLGMPFAQIIIHRLTSDAIKPYQGRYQHAVGVELSKERPYESAIKSAIEIRESVRDAK